MSVLVIRDITERSLHQLQDAFLALASHELRTPLTPLQSYLELIARTLGRKDPADPDIARTLRYAGIAGGQVRRLGRLVDDLLDVARLQTGKLTLRRAPVRVDELAGRAIEIAQTLAAGQAIALDASGLPLTVDADAERLEQVLLNLLTNAITHAPGTERIDVCVRREGGEAIIEVRDNGPGIAAAELPHVFSRFYQTRQRREGGGGLGLGLFIAREIVVAHGGAIAVDSIKGQGATFTVRLPLDLSPDGAAPGPAGPGEDAAGGMA